MNRLTFLEREISRRPLRMFVTLLSVALGVASVASVRLASVAAGTVFQQLQDAVRGKFDLEIVSDSGGRFEQAQLNPIVHLPGVQSLTALLHRTVITYANGKRATVTAVAFDPADSAYRERLEAIEGSVFSDQPAAPPTTDTNAQALPDGDSDDAEQDDGIKDTEALVEASFAHMLGLKAGGRFSLLMPRGPMRLRARGIVKLTAGIGALAEASVFFRLADLQQSLKASGQIDEARIVLKPGYQVKRASAEIANILPQGLIVRTPLDRTEFAGETLRGVDYALYFAQALALLMGVFISLNTYMISVRERRRQWGILLAIGMSPRQVLRMIIFEAIAVGIGGSTLGLILGVAGARYLTQAIASLMETPASVVSVDLFTTVVALSLGPMLTILGCYLPARDAMRIPPVEAMRGEEPQGIEPFPMMAVILASAAWSTAVVVIWLSVTSKIPALFSIPAGIMMMLGFVLMVPPLLEPLASGFSRLFFSNRWPAESELARRQVFLKPRRTALTTAVLIVALGEGIGLGHTIINTLEDVRDWYKRALAADAVLLPNEPSQSITFGIKARSRMDAKIAEIPGVTRVKSLRIASVRAKEIPALLIARDFPDRDPLPWPLKSAEAETVRSKIAQEQVVIGSVLAKRTGVSVGDQLRVERDGKAAMVEVAAIVTDYHAGGLSIYLRREAALSKFGIDGVDMFLLNFDTKNREAVEKRITEFCVGANLTKRSFEELQRFLDGMMAKVVAAFWGVLVVGLVIAGFGAFNTLSMNVLEQTHEIGLMRIIGMTSGQIHRMVLFQAVILGFLSEVFGTLAGITTAYIIHLCMGGLIMRVVAFHWRPVMLIGCNVVAILLILPAALFPAWSATRSNIWEALHDE